MEGREPRRVGSNEQGGRLLLRLTSLYLYYTGGLERQYQRSIGRGEPPWRILRYERVTAPEKHVVPISLNRFVRPKTFEMHLQYLKRKCNVVPLQSLIADVLAGKPIPQKTVVLTFDGGWLDCYADAFPRLKHYELPATVFVPTYFIGTLDMFWQDKLLLAVINLHHARANLADHDVFRRYFPGLKSTVDESLSDAARFASDFVNILRLVPPEERQQTMEELATLIDRIGGMVTERCFLSWPELQEMATAGITVGSLGAVNRLVSESSEEVLAADVHASVQALREHGIAPLPIFAFPDGEVSKEARHTLQRLGVKCSLGIGRYPLPKDRAKNLAVLGRIPLYEGVSFCPDFLALRLWADERNG